MEKLTNTEEKDSKECPRYTTVCLSRNIRTSQSRLYGDESRDISGVQDLWHEFSWHCPGAHPRSPRVAPVGKLIWRTQFHCRVYGEYGRTRMVLTIGLRWDVWRACVVSRGCVMKAWGYRRVFFTATQHAVCYKQLMKEAEEVVFQDEMIPEEKSWNESKGTSAFVVKSPNLLWTQRVGCISSSSWCGRRTKWIWQR